MPCGSLRATTDNMLVLIGSHALKHYGRLHGREPADWDVMSKATKQKIVYGGQVVEFSAANDPENATNAFLYLYSVYMADDEVETPAGKALVAPLEVLKVLKMSCANHMDKAKHAWDLKYLTDIKLPDVLNIVMHVRYGEIAERVKRQKEQFFNKYNIKRYLEHDRLHTFVNPVPTYTKALEDAVNISRERFLALSITDQVNVLREEALVLALERELIPQVVKHPSLAPVFYNKFAMVRTSADPAIRWLSRLSIPGKLKDHPDWLAIWAEEASDILLDGYETWWQEKLDQLSKEFWTEVLTIAHHQESESHAPNNEKAATC
jgi:hypothetical protein